MNGNWIRLAREELYRKVWAAPMKTVAQEFAVSALGARECMPQAQYSCSGGGSWTKIEVRSRARRSPARASLLWFPLV